MEIKKLNFEKKEVQIKETYIDEAGKIRERVKTVRMPTGKVLPQFHAESGDGDEK